MVRRVKARDRIILVGVLKRKRDLIILRRDHWYRIPVAKMPRRKFHYLAFYEPARLGRQGKCIRFYARVLRYQVEKRCDLLPDEPYHPSAGENYVKIQVDRLLYLPWTIKNVPPRRVSFGFATLKRLLTSRNILQLYSVLPTEEMVGGALKSAGISVVPQYYVSGNSRRYYLDFAVICRQGRIAIECDNFKAHSGRGRRRQDRAKDLFLRQQGWRVIRLKEHAVVSDIDSCIFRVRSVIRRLGGLP